MSNGALRRRGFNWRNLIGQSVHLEREMILFVLASALDVFMTYLLLRYSSDGRTQLQVVESNPVARYFFIHWGIRGMIFFKFSLVAFVVVISQIIASRRPRTAMYLLRFAICLVSLVVIYSFLLLFRAGMTFAAHLAESNVAGTVAVAVPL